jgi:hypothetical protein
MDETGASKYNVTPDWVYPGQPSPHYVEPGDGKESLRDKLEGLKNRFLSLFGKEEPLTEEEAFKMMMERRSTYTFCYDWRQDMFKTAEELRAYIEYMKELTGFDTVSLIGFSEGAAVLGTYLTVYGFEDLESVIWYAGAHNGVELVGQLFTGRIHVDADALTAYVRENDGDGIAAGLISCFAGALGEIGVTGNRLGYTNAIIGALLKDGGVKTILRRTVATMPAVWSLIGDKYYEEAKAYVFDQPGDEKTYGALIETIDRYHYGVQAHSADLQAEALAATGRIGVVVKYGLQVTPMIENDRVLSDGLIDVAGASGGATAALLGGTLGANYTQAVADGHNHLSADGMIDASTALFPEYTWFLKNHGHAGTPDAIEDLFFKIAYAGRQPTVHDDAAYPQFMVYEPIDGSCSPLDGGSRSPIARALLRIRVFLTTLFERVKGYFVKEE